MKYVLVFGLLFLVGAGCLYLGNQPDINSDLRRWMVDIEIMILQAERDWRELPNLLPENSPKKSDQPY